MYDMREAGVKQLVCPSVCLSSEKKLKSRKFTGLKWFLNPKVNIGTQHTKKYLCL